MEPVVLVDGAGLGIPLGRLRDQTVGGGGQHGYVALLLAESLAAQQTRGRHRLTLRGRESLDLADGARAPVADLHVARGAGLVGDGVEPDRRALQRLAVDLESELGP